MAQTFRNLVGGVGVFILFGVYHGLTNGLVFFDIVNVEVQHYRPTHPGKVSLKSDL